MRNAGAWTRPSISGGAERQGEDRAMALVLDLDLAAVGERVLAEKILEDPTRLSKRLGEGGDVVRAGPADQIGLLEAVAADIEEIAGHGPITPIPREPIPFTRFPRPDGERVAIGSPTRLKHFFAGRDMVRQCGPGRWLCVDRPHERRAARE